MNSESSLLSKINSKYILKRILSLAYDNMKSVLRLTKYNKCLRSKLDINCEDNFKYEIEIKTEVNKDDSNDIKFLGLFLFFDVFWFIVFLIYIIFFHVRGKFNDKNLKEGYSEKKKDFVDFMDNYILLAYFLFNFATILIAILLYRCNLFATKGYIKLLICIFISIIEFTHHITYIIKYTYTKELIKNELIKLVNKADKVLTEEEKKEKLKILKLIWFYSFDYVIIIFICLHFLYLILLLIIIIFILKDREIVCCKKKTILLNQFKGLNIIKKELPKKFDNLSEKEKKEFIFKKENIKEYEYKLNENQINLIDKINDIRKKNHIPLLKYFEREKLPEFIINEKTQIIFNDNENLFKLSPNFYVFKYQINEFRNFLNNNQILNIITIETLKEINIIQQNNFEFISIYDELNIRRNYNNKNRTQIDINTNNNIANTKDKLNEVTERVTETEVSDNYGNKMQRIRNIKINKNNFEKE